jgi:hypothetical protein
VQGRFDRLMAMPGTFGRLARVRMAIGLSRLYELAPEWTQKTLVPLFDWSSPDAPAMWSARKFSNYIGPPSLFALVKQPFLDLFGRVEMTARDRDAFSGWIAAISIANQAGRATYPLSFPEARAALRKAGAEVLRNIGHRLAMQMESAEPGQKVSRWRDIVGPVFRGIWPLDPELQSSASTFKLVQILRATGDAFPEAADEIVPFIHPDRPERQSTIYSIAKADDALFRSSPGRMLDLLTAVVADAPPRSVHSLRTALDKVRAADPELAETRKFQKLLARAEAA